MTGDEDYLAARAIEYGTYVATQTIYYNGVRAYNVGYPVPVSNVEKYGYLEQGLVRRAVEELAGGESRHLDKRDAEAAVSQRVITIYCEGKQKEQPDSSPLPLPGQSHRHKQRLRPTHKPKDLEAAFVSNPYYEPERWKAEGADVERDQLVHPADANAAPGMLHYYNQVTERVTISCRRCGYEVELGDRLGVGYPTMVEGRAAAAVGNGYRTKPERLAADRLSPSLENEPIPAPVPVQPMRPDIALAMAGQPTVSTNPALHKQLSTFADMFADADGVSRLPLSALDRIVRAFH